MRNWNLRRDMNFDGNFTISDVKLFAESVYFYPGDLIIKLINGTEIGAFLEISHKNYGGMLSALLSLAVWCIVGVLLFRICISIRNFFASVIGKSKRSES